MRLSHDFPFAAGNGVQAGPLIAFARDALSRNEVVPLYQPIFDLRSCRITGFEAQLHWQQANGRCGRPEMFLPAFADRQLGAILGSRMIAQAFDDMQRWHHLGLAFGTMAIKASAVDFVRDDYAETLLVALKHRDLPPSMLIVEVPEGALSYDCPYIQRTLKILSFHGVRIALDDFGTGFASFLQLKQVPVDIVKIDRSLIAGAGRNEQDNALVLTLVALGASLGGRTVADGIETLVQAEFLHAVGCDMGQGHVFGAALSAADVPALINCLAVSATG